MPSKMNYNTNECARISKLVAVGGKKKYTCKMGRDFGPSIWAGLPNYNTNECPRFSKLVPVGGKKIYMQDGQGFWAFNLGLVFGLGSLSEQRDQGKVLNVFNLGSSF